MKILDRIIRVHFASLDIFVIAIGLSPGGSSTVPSYTKQQYTEQHNNTINTLRNIQNNKNATEIYYYAAQIVEI